MIIRPDAGILRAETDGKTTGVHLHPMSEAEFKEHVENEKRKREAAEAERGRITLSDVLLLLITLTLSYMSVYALTVAI